VGLRERLDGLDAKEGTSAVSEVPHHLHAAADRKAPRLGAAAWVLGVFVAFLPLGLVSLWAASAVLDGFGLAGENRELVTGGTAVIWSVLLTLAIVLVGTVLGLVARRRFKVMDFLSYVLAVAAAYLIPLAVRLAAGEGRFDVDWAMPQLLIPIGFLAVGTATVAASFAEPAAAAMWRMTLRAAWGLLLTLALPTMVAVAAGARVPGSSVAIAMVLGYFGALAIRWCVLKTRRYVPT